MTDIYEIEDDDVRVSIRPAIPIKIMHVWWKEADKVLSCTFEKIDSVSRSLEKSKQNSL